jgi:hypothetical protein
MLSPEVQKLLVKIWDAGIWVRLLQNRDGSCWISILSPLTSGKYLAYAAQGDDVETTIIQAVRKLENPEDILDA